MNQPSENPFASPGMEETYERVSREAEVVEEEVWNDKFVMHFGMIVGDSPLALPAVCLHCATDIRDDFGVRECEQFHRLRLLEAEKPVFMKVAYSLCSTCVEAADSWRRRSRIALTFVLACFLSGFLILVGMMAGDNWDPTSGPIWASCFLLCIFAGVGGFFRVIYCEAKFTKRFVLNKFVGKTMTLSGASWKFIQRYR